MLLINRGFFPAEGLRRFKLNMARNVLNVCDNGVSLTCAVFESAWSSANEQQLTEIFTNSLPFLFDDEEAFRSKLASQLGRPFKLHPEFAATNNAIFAWLIQSLPIMLHGATLELHHPKRPRTWEIIECCECCLSELQARHASMLDDELVRLLRERYQTGVRLTKFWVSRGVRERTYYDHAVLINCISDSIEVILGDLESSESDLLVEIAEAQAQSALRVISDEAFGMLDKLQGSLQYAYPIYGSSAFSNSLS